ncbi:MAG: hypothetical protein SPL49_08180 [Oribacterium sp.]|nr:hypothetical protein [Oribacterium sp.]MDY6317177.1 hypothetical protein [Oribacterium sp.]
MVKFTSHGVFLGGNGNMFGSQAVASPDLSQAFPKDANAGRART